MIGEEKAKEDIAGYVKIILLEEGLIPSALPPKQASNLEGVNTLHVNIVTMRQIVQQGLKALGYNLGEVISVESSRGADYAFDIKTESGKEIGL